MEKINDDIDKENDPSSSSLLVKSSQLLGNCTKPKQNVSKHLSLRDSFIYLDFNNYLKTYLKLQIAFG